jgi:hypothetical protein
MAGGSLMKHDQFIDKFGWNIQNLFSMVAKCKFDHKICNISINYGSNTIFSGQAPYTMICA